MKTNSIRIGDHFGRIFPGEYPQTFCFVPEECLWSEGGSLHLMEGDYVRSGWDVLNMRLNDAGEGQHLFPCADLLPADLEPSLAKTFLHRVEFIQASRNKATSAA